MGTALSKKKTHDHEETKKERLEDVIRSACDVDEDGVPKIGQEEFKEDLGFSKSRNLSNFELLKKARDCIHQGNLMFRESRYDIARNRYSLALSVLRSGHDIDNAHIATILNNLGIMEYAEGRYEEAKQLHRESLNIRREMLAALGETDTSLIQQDIGQGLERLVLKMRSAVIKHQEHVNNHTLSPNAIESEKLRDREAFVAKLEEHSAFDAVVADSLNNVAACLVAQRQYDDARRFFEESLEIRKMIFGESSIPVAESMENLATILDILGQTARAESLLRESLGIVQEQLGGDSLDTATVENNLGVLLSHAGKLTEAVEYLESAATTRERLLGPYHQHTTSTRQNLEYVLSRLEKPKTAIGASVQDTRESKPSGSPLKSTPTPQPSLPSTMPVSVPTVPVPSHTQSDFNIGDSNGVSGDLKRKATVEDDYGRRKGERALMRSEDKVLGDVFAASTGAGEDGDAEATGGVADDVIVNKALSTMLREKAVVAGTGTVEQTTTQLGSMTPSPPPPSSAAAAEPKPVSSAPRPVPESRSESGLWEGEHGEEGGMYRHGDIDGDNHGSSSDVVVPAETRVEVEIGGIDQETNPESDQASAEKKLPVSNSAPIPVHTPPYKPGEETVPRLTHGMDSVTAPVQEKAQPPQSTEPRVLSSSIPFAPTPASTEYGGSFRGRTDTTGSEVGYLAPQTVSTGEGGGGEKDIGEHRPLSTLGKMRKALFFGVMG